MCKGENRARRSPEEGHDETARQAGSRATRRHFSAEEKIRIVLDGLRGEDSIAGLCRKQGIAQNLYYRWCKEFLVGAVPEKRMMREGSEDRG